MVRGVAETFHSRSFRAGSLRLAVPTSARSSAARELVRISAADRPLHVRSESVGAFLLSNYFPRCSICLPPLPAAPRRQTSSPVGPSSTSSPAFLTICRPVLGGRVASATAYLVPKSVRACPCSRPRASRSSSHRSLRKDLERGLADGVRIVLEREDSMPAIASSGWGSSGGRGTKTARSRRMGTPERLVATFDLVKRSRSGTATRCSCAAVGPSTSTDGGVGSRARCIRRKAR